MSNRANKVSAREMYVDDYRSIICIVRKKKKTKAEEKMGIAEQMKIYIPIACNPNISMFIGLVMMAVVSRQNVTGRAENVHFSSEH